MDILNENHPGIPVSFSGSAPNADFIDMTQMDYIAYNNLQERETILEDETSVIDYYLDFEKFDCIL